MQSRVACCPQSSRNCVGACQARSLHYKTTRRVSDQKPAQPASQPDWRTDRRTSSLAGLHPPCPVPPSSVFYMDSVALAPAHTHTTPNKPTLHAQFLIITVPSLLPPEQWCRSKFHTGHRSVSSSVSHAPKLLRFVRPPAQQTDDETSPHWHRTVDCSGAPSEASGAAE